jgi:two-component system, response regulator PdtaR
LPPSVNFHSYHKGLSKNNVAYTLENGRNVVMTGNRYDVLVAEDEAIVALALKQLFTINNFNVVGVVRSGEDLVEEFKKLNPDVIITDIHLKGNMDGIEAARIIHKKSEKTPVIFVTGYGDENTHEKAMSVSPKAFFMKPFNEMALVNTVRKCVNHNKSKLHN